MELHEKVILRQTARQLARGSAALLFGTFGVMKLLGFPSFVDIFDDYFGIPMLRYAVGSIELAGAALILTRRFVIAGAAVLLAVSIFGVVHVLALGQNPLPLAFALALTGTIIVFERRSGRSQNGERKVPNAPR